jgi:hypothetical protein
MDLAWSIATQPWLSTLCRAFSGMADHIHHRAPLACGVIGEEAGGCWRRPSPTRAQEAHQGYPPLALLTIDAIQERGGFVVPPDLWIQFAPSVAPVALPSGLLYAPPMPNAVLTGA